MKTGIEHIRAQFERMADLTREYLNQPNELNLLISLNTINYLEGLAFAAIMARKETEKDAELASVMSDEAELLRKWYYEIKLGK